MVEKLINGIPSKEYFRQYMKKLDPAIRREYGRNYYATHKEQIKEIRRRYYLKHRKEIIKRKTKYNKIYYAYAKAKNEILKKIPVDELLEEVGYLETK